MKKLLLMLAIIILAGCTPRCPCYVTGVEFAKPSDTTLKYKIFYRDESGNAETVFSDSAYQVGTLIIY